MLITGRASLDLTDVAIIQGISGLNTRAYLGSFPDGLAGEPVSSSEFDLFPVSLCAEILQSRFSLICDFFFFLQASGMLMLFYPDWCSGLSLPAATSMLGLNAITELNCLTYDREYKGLATNTAVFLASRSPAAV